MLCSPLDQRAPGHLPGGTGIELEHMTPDAPMRFAIPPLRLSFRTRFGSRVREHTAVLASVAIEADDHVVRLVWQTSLRVPPNLIDCLDQTIVEESRA